MKENHNFEKARFIGQPKDGSKNYGISGWKSKKPYIDI